MTLDGVGVGPAGGVASAVDIFVDESDGALALGSRVVPVGVASQEYASDVLATRTGSVRHVSRGKLSGESQALNRFGILETGSHDGITSSVDGVAEMPQVFVVLAVGIFIGVNHGALTSG